MTSTPTALNQAMESGVDVAVLIPLSGTGTTKAVKHSKQKAKSMSEGKSKKAKLPKSKRGARPPKMTGYTWRKDGAGWQLRKSVYESDGTGTQKRRRPYVGHLSKSAF